MKVPDGLSTFRGAQERGRRPFIDAREHKEQSLISRHLLRRCFNPETIVEMSEHICTFFFFFFAARWRSGRDRCDGELLVFSPN